MRQGLHIQWLADRAECITAMINLQKSLWHVSVAQCPLLLTINVYTSKLSCTKFVSAVYDFSTINYEELSAEEKHFSWSRPFIEEVWPKSISFLSLFYIYVLYYIFYLYLYFYSSFYWFALIVIWRMWQSALTHADSWAPLCGGILQKTMTPQYPRLRKCILLCSELVGCANNMGAGWRSMYFGKCHGELSALQLLLIQLSSRDW